MSDIVLVRREPPENRSPGGILLPDRAQEPPLQGEVLAVGPGKWDEKLGARVKIGVRPGEVVLYTRFAGNAVPWDDTLLLMPEEQVLGVVE